MLGTKIIKRIKELNYKQVTVAKKVGVSPSSLSHYIKNKREPSFKTLCKLAKVLKTDLNYFSDDQYFGLKLW